MTTLLPIKCHTPEGCCTQCCGPLDLAKLITNSPYVMTTEVPEVRELVQSTVKLGETIGNQNQLSPRPGQSRRNHSFWKTL